MQEKLYWHMENLKPNKTLTEDIWLSVQESKTTIKCKIYIRKLGTPLYFLKNILICLLKQMSNKVLI